MRIQVAGRRHRTDEAAGLSVFCGTFKIDIDQLEEE
jgi:hypothetical protein